MQEKSTPSLRLKTTARQQRRNAARLAGGACAHTTRDWRVRIVERLVREQPARGLPESAWRGQAPVSPSVLVDGHVAAGANPAARCNAGTVAHRISGPGMWRLPPGAPSGPPRPMSGPSTVSPGSAWGRSCGSSVGSGGCPGDPDTPWGGGGKVPVFS